MTPTEVEPATFRFVAQHINHCAATSNYMDLSTYLSANFVSNSQIFWYQCPDQYKI